MTTRTTRILLFGALGVALVVIVALVATLAGVQAMAPLRLLPSYPWSALAAEASTMNDCAECHDLGELHACQDCHDEHGGAALTNLTFGALVLLTGDVPDAGYIPVQQIVPERDGRLTHVGLLDFLAAHGVTEFESVTLVGSDGGMATIERQYLTDEALLLPYVDGIRFAAENLHVSTWLKGITRIVVVGAETPLTVDGRPTSIGRLLVGPQMSVTIEQTDVMLKSEDDGQIRRGKTAARLEGAPLSSLIARPGFQALYVRDEAGRERTLQAGEVARAVLALVRGKATLVLPERGRSEWISGVVEIRAEG